MAGALALAALALACEKRAPDPGGWPSVRLAYQRVGPYRAFFVAQEKGYFVDEQVTVEATEYPSSNAIGQAQLAGKIDGSGFMSFPSLFAMEQEVPGQSVCTLLLPMTGKSRFAGIVVSLASKVTSPVELRGAKIGVYPASTNVIYARMMQKRLFGSTDASSIVQVDPSTALELLATGGIDALIGPDPMPATAVARHVGRVILYSPDALYVMEPMPVGCASLSRAFQTRQPEAARRVRRALERAVDYLRDPAHAVEVRAIVGRRTGVDSAVVEQLGDVDYWKLAEASGEPLQKLSDLLLAEGVLSRPVRASALLEQP